MKEGQASTFLCPHNTDTGWNREDFIQGTDTPIHPETDITYEMEVKTCSGTPNGRQICVENVICSFRK